MNPLPEQELRDLIDAVCCDALPNELVGSLESALQQDATSRQQYFQAIALTTNIHFWLRAENSATRAIDALQQKTKPQPVRPAVAALLRFGLLYRVLSHTTIGAISLAALTFYGTFAVLVWTMSWRSTSPIVGESGTTSTAQIATLDNVSWSRNSVIYARDALIPTHKSLGIDKGVLELKLKQGVTLFVHGPAQWSVDGDNCVSLRAGKLLARVSEQAIGFTVETPTAKVVDLGTEFGVEVSKSGTTEVQVLKGKVKLQAGVKGNISSQTDQSIILSAGEARRVERDANNESVVVRNVISTPERFADLTFAVPAPLTKQIRVEGVLASSTVGAVLLDADHLIRGHGLQGDRHSATWENTMWHSNYGDVKNVVMAFDLARPHLLDSMKVWNFNCGANYAWAGVKQADIYASISGKGDPLSKPAEWTLVVADRQFTPGTGKDDYDTPTIISLGNVKARFIALVIDEALGTDPRPETPAHHRNVVGLSEVQFFGSRVKSK